MILRLIHFSVTFTHISETGVMDGFHAFDCYAFNEKSAINRMTKKFKKLHYMKMISIPNNYFNTWITDCEVI